MGVFKRITLTELLEMAQNAKGGIDHIYIHWTAGNYQQYFSDYHLLFDFDGKIIASTDDLTERKNHTYQRNGRAIGAAMCCCQGATCWADGTVDFGVQPPTAEMIDATAQAVAVLCNGLGLDINKNTVMTHCEAAELDGYGPSTTCERWDLWKLPDLPGSGEIGNGGDIIRGKAIYWREYWKEHGFN